MLPKHRQAPSLTSSAKRTRSTTSNSTSAQATPSDTSNIRELSLSDLASLPAKTLRSQLKSYKLSPMGNKSIMANHLYQFLHPTSASTGLGTVPSMPSSTINVPRQIMEQLSSFFQQLNSATTSITGDTSGNYPPSADNVSPDANEMLSAASDLVAYDDQQPPTTTTTTTISNLVPSYSTMIQHPATTTATVPLHPNPTIVQPPALIPPTANQPPVASTSVPVLIRNTVNQPSLPPVPPRIRDRIVRSEFVDFANLLPKAMFSGGSEPEICRSLTVQLASSGDDISIQPASNSRKITSFASWMEAWNIYLSIVIDHTPARAAEFVAYQRIITSASIQYPTAAWLNYDVQFRTLAASDPTLRWDARHTDLWLQFMTSAKPTQSARGPCKHCGATNHYPDNCPFRPNYSPTITGGQRAVTRGQPNSGSYMAPHPNQPPKPIACRDFNRYICRRPDCKFAHCCEHCRVNHAVKDCAKYGWPSHTH